MAHRWLYVGASALSIGLTLMVRVATGIEHSPACSTTLLFSLGVFQPAWQIGVLVVGVALLLLCGAVLNHMVGYRGPHVSVDAGCGADLHGPGGMEERP